MSNDKPKHDPKHDAKAEPKSEPQSGPKVPGDNRNFKAGIAVGIGSAAIVAALLYARTGKPQKKK